MTKFAPLILLSILLSCTELHAQTTQPPASMPADREEISRTDLFRRSELSIHRGVKFLLSRQNSDGSWTDEPIDKDGTTALVTLALIFAGESHQSPALERAIKYLKAAQPQRSLHATYSVALRAAVYASLPEPMRKAELQADLRWLESAVIRDGNRRGMYDYGMGRRAGGDFSNSQYGVLGVWYAAQAGLEVPRSYWKEVEDGWLAGQNEDGGWPYRPGFGPSYSSMTAAAAATLYITNDYLHSQDYHDLDKTTVNKPLQGAMKWLTDNFAPDKNSGQDEAPARGRGRGRGDPGVMDLLGQLGRSPGFYIHYMLFGFERVGEASGLTRFGDRKWFDEGADYLIRTQGYDGSWTGMVGLQGDTAYSLLFLSRGRAPLVMQKLEFGKRWDNRPRDASSFTLFMRRATERHVNWQIVGADAPPDEFRQAPMLYVASDTELSPTTAQALKTYIDQGGLVVCANDGPGSTFADSVVALAAKMYPAYKFRDVPPDHLIYTANFPVDKTEKIRALSNGVRELIVLYPSGDMSWKWQATGGAFLPKNSPYASLANLWLYVTDRSNPRFKGEDTWVELNPGVSITRSATLARIRHDGNWNPEPGGWTRLANIMHNFDQFDLKVEAVTDPKGAALAHLTSTDSVQLSSTAKIALKQYLDTGGLLLCDAAGGSAEAAGSFEVLLRDLYPTVVIAPLPLDHRIYHAAAMGGTDIEEVNYRRSRDLSPIHTPRLRGATVSGKLVAIVSNEDLSGGLVGYSTAGLTGYMPSSAVDLVRNIILWRTSALK